MSRQFLKVNAKAIITSTAIAFTVLAATRSCLPRETPFIVIDDKTGSMPEGSIPFDVSVKTNMRINQQYLDVTKEHGKNKYKCAKFFRIS